MNLATKIALRYALTFRSFHFITVISIMSAFGIVVGSCALICVTSIFNGFREYSENRLTKFDPHVRVTSAKGAFLGNPDSLISLLKSSPGVTAASKVDRGRVAILRRGALRTAYLNGVDRAEYMRISDVAANMVGGEFRLTNVDSTPAVVLGIMLANALQLAPGDTITIVSPKTLESAIKTFRPNSGFKAVVAGMFFANSKEYDEFHAFSNRDLSKALFGVGPDGSTDIDLKLKNIDDADRVKARTEQIDTNLAAFTWYDLHSDLYNIMRLERLGSFTVIGLIVMIAVFNVFASLSMTVVEKRADIAVMNTFGASPGFIRRVYLTEGLIIGSSGAILGTLLGLALSYGQQYFGWIKLDTDKYLLEALPVSIDYFYVVLTAVFSLTLTVLAAVVPANRAAKTTVMSALRSE